MNKRIRTSLLIGVVAGALTYSLQPYQENDRLLIALGLLAFGSAFLIGLFSKKFEMVIAAFLCVGMAFGVFGRIAFDGIFINPTSHNLWPLEILYALAFIVPMAFAGAWVSWLANKKRN